MTATLTANPSTPAPPRRKPRQSDVVRRMRAAFVRAYTTPGSDCHHNATKSYIAAGYSETGANAGASRLLSVPSVRSAVDEAERKFTERIIERGLVTVEKIQKGHIDLVDRCLATGNVEVATRNWEDLGKTVGAYAERIEVDITVQHEYDERLAIEASRLARLALEEAGDRGLGLVRDAEAEVLPALPGPAGAAAVQAESAAPVAADEPGPAVSPDPVEPAAPVEDSAAAIEARAAEEAARKRERYEAACRRRRARRPSVRPPGPASGNPAE